MAKKSVKIKVRENQEDLLPEGIENDPTPKSSCALWAVFLLLIVILLILIGSLFYLKAKKFATSVPKANLNINSMQVTSLSAEEVTVKLTEAEIQSAINANDVNFPLKKATVKVNPDKIVLSGKTGNSFWGVSVEVGLMPRIEAGKVIFDITEIKSAGLTAPKSISDLINKNLGQYLDGLSSSMGDIEFSKVELSNGYIVATGKRK